MAEFKVCGMKAFVTYTWPGQNKTAACLEHATSVARLANLMGFVVNMLPIQKDSGQTCEHEIKVEEI
jgi:hypothetical protein